jgi:hypothetical protein
VEFDPFSGTGVNTLELVWEPCVNNFGMVPPLVVCCVSQNDTVSVSVMRLYELGDHEVESPMRQMSFKLPLAVAHALGEQRRRAPELLARLSMASLLRF